MSPGAAAGPTGARERLLDAAIAHFAAHGIGETSLRGLAEAIGTSHRMLIYHFGSRDGLLAAVVDRVEQVQRDALADLTATSGGARAPEFPASDPVAQGEAFWQQVTVAATTYGPLFFELAGHAMQGRPHAAGLRTELIGPWLEPLAELAVAPGSHPRTPGPRPG